MTTEATRTSISLNTHALLTRFALQSSEWEFLDMKYPVVPLEELLSASGSRLQELVSWYGHLLAAKGCFAVPGGEPPQEIVTESGFLDALRLNPAYCIHYVVVLKLREMPADSRHDAGRSGPPGGAYVPTSFGETVSARRILSTFSDEPDWGMDQGLFLIERYGYGPQPYGTLTGVSSQAPFHMAFLYEPKPLLWAMPLLRRNFVEERVRVCLALAHLAFSCGMDYWGWRFAAWAMHYLQDLTQPYHARSLPFSTVRLLKRLISGRPWRVTERYGNLLRNRHMLFEAVVHFLLNEALKKGAHEELVRALSYGGDAGVQEVRVIMAQSAKVVARLAPRVNVALEKLMDEPRLDDAAYSLDRDPLYRIEEALPRLGHDRPRDFSRFLELLAVCLVEAGRVTRYTVRVGAAAINFSDH